MTLEILPLGVGDAFSAEHYSFCLLVSHIDDDGKTSRLLIDCPHPVRKALREASSRAGTPLDLHDVDAVILTHLHGDHASGLESFGYFNTFALGRKPVLYAHPDVSARLWEGHLAAGMEQLMTLDEQGGRCFIERSLDESFELRGLDVDAAVRFGPFVIECRKTLHHIPTTALRITAGAGSAKRSVGISADTAFDPSLIEWLDEADLIIHETNFGPAHTAFDDLLELDHRIRAKTRLIHYPDGFACEEFTLCEEGVALRL